MPVGVDSLEVKKPGGIPNGGASPTGEYVDIPTDEENVYSDNEQPRNKGLAVPKNDDEGGITDSEDVHGSEDEEEFYKEKVKNRPTLQELGILDENPTTETINLTEGYAPDAGPVLSASEDENDTRMHTRHKKNMKTMTKFSQSLGAPQDTDEGTTDVEDMEGDNEVLYKFRRDDSLPSHYMDKDDGTIESKEKMSNVMPVSKAIPRVKHTPVDSDDDEQPKQQKKRPKGKSHLAVAVASGDESGHTDVEDLHMGGTPQIKITTGNEMPESTKPTVAGRPKKRKHKKSDKRQAAKPSASLTAPAAGEDGVTDVEELSGTCTESDSDLDADIYGLVAPVQHIDGMTDVEDIDASDDEGLIAPPIKKSEPFIIPNVHQEKIIIKDVIDKPKDEKARDTDEEDFELGDKEDSEQLSSRKHVEVRQEIKKVLLEPEDDCDEAALTDMEDMDMDEKSENELVDCYASRVPKETDLLPCLKEIEGNVGNISKTEAMIDITAKKDNYDECELTFQEALATVTDVEDLDEDFGKPKVQKKKKKSKKQRKNNETDEESMNESDFEEEPHAAPSKKEKKKKGKRLPLVSQMSEVRFVETQSGPLSIIVTADELEKDPDNVIQNKLSGVLFLEEDHEGAFTDIEELSGDEGKRKKCMKKPDDNQDAITDTEDFEGEEGDLERPSTPLPTEIDYSVLRSPKRELIRIKEDEHGVPQVTIEKLQDSMLTVDDTDDMGLTDTEDFDCTEAEAGELRREHAKRAGAETNYEFPDADRSEMKTKMIVKNKPTKSAKSGLQIESGNEEGHTDVEELSMPKKSRKKKGNKDRLQPSGDRSDGNTDIEYLSDKEGKSFKIKVSAASDNEHTDTEGLDVSESEDIHPSREDCATPDIIRKAAVKRVKIIKEGQHGTTSSESQEIAPNRALGIPDDEIQGITDTSDMEGSGGEEEEIKHPEVELPEYDQGDIRITEKSNVSVNSSESKQIKDNLLLPDDDANALTDEETIGEGEGNRDP